MATPSITTKHIHNQQRGQSAFEREETLSRSHLPTIGLPSGFSGQIYMQEEYNTTMELDQKGLNCQTGLGSSFPWSLGEETHLSKIRLRLQEKVFALRYQLVSGNDGDTGLGRWSCEGGNVT